MQILSILQRWQLGKSPTPSELDEIGAAQAREVRFVGKDPRLTDLTIRSQLFQQIVGEVVQLCQELGFTDNNAILLSLWRLWLPFSLQMVSAQQDLGRPMIQGILGGQGTGKTTLTKVCGLILQYLGSSSFELSIDDLYKTYRDRKILCQDDPRLLWRGPPGTHDIDLGIQLLQQARQISRLEPLLVPQFDKSLHQGAGDRIAPKTIEKADIILFEGWFIGARPVDPALFNQRIDPIITEADQQFARDSNERLRAYLPLWALLDSFLILHPVDYRLSKQWRKEAEHQMKAQGKTGMSDGEIEQFVDYFWKALHPELFIAPLTKIPAITDLVVEINGDHSLGKIYRPTTTVEGF